jgi:hypothetical protein
VEERFLTVSYLPGNDRHWPMIRLKGLWLLHAGFTSGDKIMLAIRPGQILISNISLPPTAKEPPKVLVQGELY